MQLAGTRDMDMVGIRRRIPLDVDPSLAYEITGWVRLENAQKDDTFARLWIEWLDAEGKTSGWHQCDKVDRRYVRQARERAEKENVAGWGKWVPTPEFRINEVPRNAHSARLWCVASGRETDGYAYFDELQIRRQPKVSATPDPEDSHGVFRHDQNPALRLVFQGLHLRPKEYDPNEHEMTGYKRVIKVKDLYGRSPSEEGQTRDFDTPRVNRIEEHVRVEEICDPGTYAVEIALYVRAHSRGDPVKKLEFLVAKRVIRLTRLPVKTTRDQAAEGGFCAVDADLFNENADRLIAAIQRCGVQVVAVPLWRTGTRLGRLTSQTEEATPEEKLARRLADLTTGGRTVIGGFYPMPSPIYDALRRDWLGGARTMYKADSDIWQPLVKETVAHFRGSVSEWRMAAASDASFGAGAADRTGLAARLRQELARATGKRVVVPVPLEDLTKPAPPITQPNYHELVFIPANVPATGSSGDGNEKSLEEKLRQLFPPPTPRVTARPAAKPGQPAAEAPEPKTAAPAPVPRPAAGRRWFIQLRPVSENLTLEVVGERHQVIDMARKITLLAMYGADRVHVQLADPRQGLLGPGLLARPVYSAYRVLAEHLSGAKYLGEFDLTAGAQAYAFERGDEALVVFWTDGTEGKAPCQLGISEKAKTKVSDEADSGASGRAEPGASGRGESGARGEAKMIELTGKEVPLNKKAVGAEARGLADAMMVNVRKVPALLVGLDPDFIRTRMGFRLAAGSRLQTRYQPQEVRFEVRNFFDNTMRARVMPRFPRGSHTMPRFREVTVEAGKSAEVSFRVRPSFVETVGNKKIGVDLQLFSAKGEKVSFTLTRHIPVESPILLQCKTGKLSNNRDVSVQVSVQLSNAPEYAYQKDKRDHGLNPETAYDVEVYLVVPGGARQRTYVRNIMPGESPKSPDQTFVVKAGNAPKTVYVGARLRGGVWFSNTEEQIPAAKPAAPPESE
jgi:hypothetical protein